jgi:HAE1 family hydrophobic/amphiphilic exporter-1
LRLIVSNIGTTPGFSSLYTPNSASHTAFVQVSLNDDHKVGSYEYMDRVRAPCIGKCRRSAATSNPAVWLTRCSTSVARAHRREGQRLQSEATTMPWRSRSRRSAKTSGVSDVFIPQDIDAPALKLNINRIRASELGLSQKEVVDNVISALTSNAMIAPSYWVDPKTGNDYLLTVQYPEGR